MISCASGPRGVRVRRADRRFQHLPAGRARITPVIGRKIASGALRGVCARAARESAPPGRGWGSSARARAPCDGRCAAPVGQWVPSARRCTSSAGGCSPSVDGCAPSASGCASSADGCASPVCRCTSSTDGCAASACRCARLPDGCARPGSRCGWRAARCAPAVSGCTPSGGGWAPSGSSCAPRSRAARSSGRRLGDRAARLDRRARTLVIGRRRWRAVVGAHARRARGFDDQARRCVRWAGGSVGRAAARRIESRGRLVGPRGSIELSDRSLQQNLDAVR